MAGEMPDPLYVSFGKLLSVLPRLRSRSGCGGPPWPRVGGPLPSLSVRLAKLRMGRRRETCTPLVAMPCAACGGLHTTCPHYSGGRDEHPDARLPTSDELRRLQTAAAAPRPAVRGKIIRQSGKKLQCFYNATAAELSRMRHACAPRDARQLLSSISSWLCSPGATTARVPDGRLLSDYLCDEGESLESRASAVLREGTTMSTGGTVEAVALFHLYEVPVRTFVSGGKEGCFHLVEQQLPARARDFEDGINLVHDGVRSCT